MKLYNPSEAPRRLKTKCEIVDGVLYSIVFFSYILTLPQFSLRNPAEIRALDNVRTNVRNWVFAPYILTTKSLQTPPIGLTRRPLDDKPFRLISFGLTKSPKQNHNGKITKPNRTRL